MSRAKLIILVKSRWVCNSTSEPIWLYVFREGPLAPPFFCRGTPCGCPGTGRHKACPYEMYDPKIHHRRSIRWRQHDYSSPGGYYVTICVEDYRFVFGYVSAGLMKLSDAGRMVSAQWEEMPTRFPTMKLDEFIVIPNHFHGILHIVGAPLVGAPTVGAPLVGAQMVAGTAQQGTRAGTRPAPTLGDAIGAFKSLTTDGYITGVRELG